MNKRNVLPIIIAVCGVLASACTPSVPSTPAHPPNDNDTVTVPPDNPTFTPHASAAGIENRVAQLDERLVDFALGGSDDFRWANGYSNGGMFNCTWRNRNATISDGIMSMSVTQDGSGYAGAEYRSQNKYSYGFYSVCMKAADCSGVISSFFTYTGPSNNDPWDEIDIEFLGKDMNGVQFNYFTNGVGEHSFFLELGFDASKGFHEYAFDWQPDSITWYVDGIAVYRVTDNLPSHPMQIMMNVWNCQYTDDWSGVFDTSALPATAQYKWFAYSI